MLALLLLVLGGPALAQATAVTNLSPLPLASGVNRVERLAPDGRAGLITLAWRDNGNAWGYDVYTVMLQGPGPTWSLAGIELSNEEFADTIRDMPHTGEDVAMAVRFARAQVDGRSAVVLLRAVRDWKDTPFDPASTRFEVFALRAGEVGTTTQYFARVSTTNLPDRYCNAEMALARASGLPIRPGYEGRRTPTGC